MTATVQTMAPLILKTFASFHPDSSPAVVDIMLESYQFIMTKLPARHTERLVLEDPERQVYDEFKTEMSQKIPGKINNIRAFRKWLSMLKIPRIFELVRSTFAQHPQSKIVVFTESYSQYLYIPK